LLLLVPAVVCLSVLPLLGGRAVPHWDANDMFAPYQMLIADYARHGSFLWWNPWARAGSPDFANPEIGALSPLSFALGLIFGGGQRGFVFYWLLIWTCSGFGVYALGRHWSVSAWGAVAVALSYVTSGFLTGHAEHTPWVVSAAVLPWVIWRVDVALRRSSVLVGAQAGALWGLGALSGYPGLTVLTGGYAALWILAGNLRGAPSRLEHSSDGEAANAGTPLRARAAIALAFAVVGVAVLSPSYVGFFIEARELVDRVQALTREDATLSNALHPGALATFASPYLAQLPLFNRGLWPQTDVSSTSIYTGPLVFVLGITALLVEPRNRWRWFVGALAALSIGCALGDTLPFRGWLYDWIAPTRYFRHAAMFRLFYVFSMSALALACLSSGSGPARYRRHLRAALPVAIVAMVAAIAAFVTTLAASRLRGSDLSFGAAHVLIVWLAAVAVLALFRSRQAVASEQVFAGTVVALAFFDAVGSGRLSRPITLERDPGQRRIWRELERSRQSSLGLGSLHRSERTPVGQANHNLPIKIAALEGRSPFIDGLFRSFVANPVLNRAATGSDRIYFAPDAPVVPRERAVFDVFAERAEEVSGLPLVIHRPHDPASGADADLAVEDAAAMIAKLEPARPIAVELRHYSPRVLAFDVSAPRPGWLLVTDRWAPSWSARVGAAPALVHNACFLFRAIQVPAGTTHIEFTYAPRLAWALLASSWLTLLATALTCSNRLLRLAGRSVGVHRAHG
jgi:hypothetical protein